MFLCLVIVIDLDHIFKEAWLQKDWVHPHPYKGTKEKKKKGFEYYRSGLWNWSHPTSKTPLIFRRMKVEVSSFARPDAQQIKRKLWGKKKKHPEENIHAFIQKKGHKSRHRFPSLFSFLFLIKLRLLRIWFLLPQIQNTRRARNISIPACLSAPAVAIIQKAHHIKLPLKTRNMCSVFGLDPK